MADTSPSRDGSCRCGRVRFRITAAPLVTMVCHCRGCQRMTASAFSLSAAIPSEGFAVTEGEPVAGGLQTEMQHLFCPHCKGWVFTRMPGMDRFVNVRATLLDQPGDWTTPFVETYASTKLPWITTPAAHSFPEFPPIEAWEGLVREYAAQTNRAPEPPTRAG